MNRRPVNRRSMLASIALIAGGALAISGCKVGSLSVSASPSASTRSSVHHKPAHRSGTHKHKSAPAKHKAPAATSKSTSPVSLAVEPAAGFSPVYSLFGRAKHSIDVTMYEFSDTTAEHDLAAAAGRGVHVEVILDRKETSTDGAAYRYLGAHGVKVTWSSSSYFYTHQKTAVIDGTEAIIMTANLTSKYYATSRDFLVLDSNHADVAAITATFTADFAHRDITPGDGTDLVWSPTDSEAKLLALINGATKSLRIYSEEMGDTTIEKALMAAARRGVDVQVCGENQDGEYDSDYTELAKAGVHIVDFSDPDGFYIHGKVVEADAGTSHARAFIGSENFSNTSLNRNRELGLITSTPSVLSAIVSSFTADFHRGKQWK